MDGFVGASGKTVLGTAGKGKIMKRRRGRWPEMALAGTAVAQGRCGNFTNGKIFAKVLGIHLNHKLFSGDGGAPQP